MHIAIVTAGGAGMFCGSCMHDNTWARSLKKQGARVTLVPTYTPLRLDEVDESTRQVFLGGINVYLDARSVLWRKVPRALTRWLDRPAILDLVTRFGISNNAKMLGELTLAMLAGEQGPQSREVNELATFLVDMLRPDAIFFSNALLVGAVGAIRRQYSGRIFCVLQGDDIFLEDLHEPYRSQALAAIGERARSFDGFFVHSAYYRDFMANYLGLPAEKFHIVPLGIDLAGHDGVPSERNGEAFTVGYFARICPEKGLHQLVEAFRLLHKRHPNTRLRAAGYLGTRDREYFEKIRAQARDLGPAFEHAGSPPTHEEKVRFLKSLDVLSVPTVYREPKGIYILEALANGVPVVQPRHGAFPEMLEATGGGLLVEPGNPEDLARALEELLKDPGGRAQLGRGGRAAVHAHYDDATMARRTLAILSGSSSSAPTGPATISVPVQALPNRS
jgi:glycosyltransferase involved in cell wall biosynthesis